MPTNNHPTNRRSPQVQPEDGTKPTVNDRYQAARQKAADYQEGDEQPEKSREAGGVKPESEWMELANQRIEEAIRQGALENLPGAGKPLDLTPDPFLPSDRQMAFNLLRNNELVPGWISERKELLAAVETLRKRMEATVARLRNEASPETAESNRQRWHVQVEKWQSEADNLNRRIRSHNLQQPVAHLEIFLFLLDEELANLGATRAAF